MRELESDRERERERDRPVVEVTTKAQSRAAKLAGRADCSGQFETEREDLTAAKQLQKSNTSMLFAYFLNTPSGNNEY